MERAATAGGTCEGDAAMIARLREQRLRKVALIVAVAAAGAVAAVQVQAGALSAGARTAGPYRYDPYGAWLDYGWPVVAKPCCFRDKDGIPLVDYGGTIGVQYNPFTAAADGLLYFSSALYNLDTSYLKQAVRDANWLVRHQQPDGRWLYHFRLIEYFIPPPWPSAIAQGAALSLLVRIWRYTGDAVYLTAAKRGLLPYSRPAWKGGVLTYWGNLPFYEEAPSANPTFILNGYMFALIGLYDVAVAAPRSPAARLYRRGWQTLVALLPLYDFSDGQSAYSLRDLTLNLPKAPTSLMYEGRHVALLRALESITPSRVLGQYLDTWNIRSIQGYIRTGAPRPGPERQFEQLWRAPGLRSLLLQP